MFSAIVSKFSKKQPGKLLNLSKEQVWDEIRKYRESIWNPSGDRSKHTLDLISSANVPQEIQFTVDCLPVLQKLLKEYPRDEVVKLLDFGPGFGAGSNLIATIHNSRFIWCKVKVDTLDHKVFRKTLSDFDYPLINYMVGSIFDLPDDKQWDITYCSNCIEHLDDPSELILALQAHTRHWVVLYAPFKENPLISGHRVSLDESFFKKFNPIKMQLIESLGWTPDKGAKQILVILQGNEKRPPPRSLFSAHTIDCPV